MELAENECYSGDGVDNEQESPDSCEGCQTVSQRTVIQIAEFPKREFPPRKIRPQRRGSWIKTLNMQPAMPIGMEMQTPKGRWPMLDGLRGVAILMVVIDHIGMPGRGGPVGVTLFFVLSGFLITNLLLKEYSLTGTINLASFYVRRALRLLPALMLYFVGSALLTLSLGFPGQWIWAETWPPLVYIANYVQIVGADLQMHWHTWSLAVEEHFYLVWPLLLGGALARKRTQLLGALLALLAAWTVLAAFVAPRWGYMASDSNAFALGAGCLISFLERGRNHPMAFRVSHPLVGVLVLAILALTGIGQEFQLIIVTISALTVWAGVEAPLGMLANAGLRGIGRISYSLYLWHIPLMMFAGAGVISRAWAAVAAMTIAALSWVLVERPLLRWRNQRWCSKAVVGNTVAVGS